MDNTLLQSNFNFITYKFTNYKYTDARNGAVCNFLAYMKKGTAKIITKRKTVKINEGDVFFIPKNLSYQSYWYGNNEIEFISLSFIELDSKEYTMLDLQSIPASKEIITSILSIPTNGKNISCYALHQFFYILHLVLPHFSKSKKGTNTLVELIKDTIRSNPFASLSTIATKCNISEPYLYTLFRKTEKYSPNDYRQKTLCDMATTLLTTTDKSIEEICSELNFSSSSYFRKVLNKHTGLTPSEIRKNRIF